MGRRVVSWLWAAMLVAGMLVGAHSAALAQAMPAPQVFPQVDHNGVDLASGDGTPVGAKGSIGGEGSGMTLDRTGTTDSFSQFSPPSTVNNFGNFLRDSYQGYLTLNCGQSCPAGVNLNNAVLSQSGNFYMSVNFGGKSAQYGPPAGSVIGTYTQSTGANGTFSCGVAPATATQCILVTHDGAVVTFDTTIIQSGLGNTYGSVTSVVKPDGEVLTYTYSGTTSAWRYTVASSLGWALKGSNGSNQLINTAAAWCDPTAYTCASLAQFPVFNDQQDQMLHGTNESLSANLLNYTFTSPTGVTRSVTKGCNAASCNPYNIAYDWDDHDDKISSATRGSTTWTYAYSLDGCCAGAPYPQGLYDTTVTNTTTGYSHVAVTWPQTGELLKFKDELNRTTSVVYTTAGDIAEIIRPDATPTNAAWTGATPTSGYTIYNYDTRNNVTSETTYPVGGGTPQVWTATYQAAGACTVLIDKSCNEPLTVTTPDGITTTFTYDSRFGGKLTETKAAVNGVQAQTRYSYSQIYPWALISAGQIAKQPPVWRLTGTSKCMTMTLATCVGSPDEVKISITYGPPGDPTPTGPLTSSPYNYVLPTVSTISRGDGSELQTTTKTYDVYGNITSLTGAMGTVNDTNYIFYDLDRHETGAIGVDPKLAGDPTDTGLRTASATAYDADGHATQVKTGTVIGTTLAALNAMIVQATTTNTYSTSTGMLQSTQVYDANGTQQKLIQYVYDSEFRVQCTVERLNSALFSSIAPSCTPGTAGPDGPDRITYYTYDPTGALLSTTSGYGTSLARVDRTDAYFASNGLLATSTDADGNVTSYNYDGFDRLVQTNYPSPTTRGSSNHYDYDLKVYSGTGGSGTLINQVRLRDGLCLNFTYDTVGRVSTKTSTTSGGACSVGGGEPAVSESFAYNLFDQPTSHTNNGVTQTYGYDSVFGITSETEPMGTVSYLYDAYGHESSVIYPGGFVVGYGYDTADRMTTVSVNGTTVGTYAYDPFRMLSLTRGNGVTTTFAYDPLWRVQTLATTLVGTGNSDNIILGFTYTAASQLKTRAATTGDALYNYVPTAAATTYAINGLNQIASTGSAPSLSYDARGNLTSDGTTTYTYNANNLLTSTGNASGQTSPVAGASLAYDADNRLLNVTSGAGTTSQFLYDGVKMIAEYNGSGTLLRRYVDGPATDDPLVWYEGTGTSDPRYYTIDEQGSVIGLTNSAGATHTNPSGGPMILAYDEYGAPAGGNLGRYSYTGQVWLPEVGLYYYKARVYSPTLGRFMQTDPIGYKDGMNWYAYVGDDPTDRGDPTGESWQIFQGTSAPGYNPSSEPDAGTNDFTSFFGAIFNDGSQQSADTANAAPAGASEASGGTPEKAASPQNQCDGNATCQAFADQGLTSTQDPDLGVQKAKSAAEEKANGPDREKWGLGALAIIEAPELIFTAVDAAAGAGVARIATLFKGCGCFVAGTLVETDHGLRPIESIKVGDNVLSRDDVSGKTAFQSVTGLIRPHDRQIYDVRLERAGHHTAELFEVTDDHPWRTVDGQWLTTLQLNVGVTIQTEDGKGVQVVSIMATHRIADTYNLTVGDFHTFFVGHNEVWVHNACDPTELHHIIPKYLGGAKNGPLAAIPRSYHQLITNAFRRLAPYGKGPRSLEEVEEIVRKVYEQHPLP